MNVSLIGYRGTGKTTVARTLQLAWGAPWDWVDADVEVELRAGKSIAAMFAEQGEAAFRELEAQVLAQLATRDHTLVATGGGVVLRADNRDVLKKLGPVVWLTARPETIYARLAADASTAERRPKLTSRGGSAEIQELLATREPWYRMCADVAVETDDRVPREIAAEITQALAPRLRPEGGA